MITDMKRFLEKLKRKVGDIQYSIELYEKEGQLKKVEDIQYSIELYEKEGQLKKVEELNIKLSTYGDIIKMIETED